VSVKDEPVDVTSTEYWYERGFREGIKLALEVLAALAVIGVVSYLANR
jgi:hypothetical protein